MKNLKKLLVTGGLMGVIMIGATAAKAGIIIIGGKAEQDTMPVNVTETVTTQDCTDTSFYGIILTDLKGLLVSDSKTVETPCQQDTSLYGLLVSD